MSSSSSCCVGPRCTPFSHRAKSKVTCRPLGKDGLDESDCSCHGTLSVACQEGSGRSYPAASSLGSSFRAIDSLYSPAQAGENRRSSSPLIMLESFVRGAPISSDDGDIRVVMISVTETGVTDNVRGPAAIQHGRLDED